jgi:para-aminobenzoate synthetase component 1
MKLEDFIERANYYGKRGIPFLFLIDFELKKPFLIKLDEAGEQSVFYQIAGTTNYTMEEPHSKHLKLDVYPSDYDQYLKSYELIMKNILAGNTYLINLTLPTKISANHSLLELYSHAYAQYKLYFKNQFTVFSPECFVKIKDNYIYSYPMKGTIDADLPDAEKQLLENKKEKWEHNTIVDLIRNDLAIVSKNICVTKFRYVSKIHTSRKNLLQISSEIRGKLSKNWQHEIGEILVTLLPAGSISGAPKRKTVEIIKEAEEINRGYFTGVFGIYDGQNIDSAVNIRFIEKAKEGLHYRSGGGITANSDPKQEYMEMLNKVYVPII